MFKRHPKHPVKQARDMVWPSMGWGRTARYYHHRLFRHRAATHRIAGGIATGCAMSCTPFLGVHVLMAMFMAWAMRMNVLAAIIGTFFGNPWTFPFIFWLDYKIGMALFDAFGGGEIMALPDVLTMQVLLANAWKLFLPMALGGVLLGLVCWPVVYVLSYWPIRGMQRAYRMRRLHRIRKARQKARQKAQLRAERQEAAGAA